LTDLILSQGSLLLGVAAELVATRQVVMTGRRWHWRTLSDVDVVVKVLCFLVTSRCGAGVVGHRMVDVGTDVQCQAC
jgi:hypothetical protein